MAMYIYTSNPERSSEGNEAYSRWKVGRPTLFPDLLPASWGKVAEQLSAKNAAVNIYKV